MIRIEGKDQDQGNGTRIRVMKWTKVRSNGKVRKWVGEYIASKRRSQQVKVYVHECTWIASQIHHQSFQVVW